MASWWTHEQPLQHHLVEDGVDLSDQTPVWLDQQPWVDVLALGLLAPNLWFLLWQMSTPMVSTLCSTRSGKLMAFLNHHDTPP